MVVLIPYIYSSFKAIFQTNQLDSEQKLPGCKFCDASAENGFHMAYEDNEFLAFEDRTPASQHHYLIVPKRHIESARSLQKSDAELVKSMEVIGHQILDSFNVDPKMRRMGFHIPPFNSVYHLHLHVQGLPYLSDSRAAKYPFREGSDGYGKGWTWFAEVQQTIQILEKGKRVAVWPT